MRVLEVVHQADAGAGIFGDAVREAGHELVTWVPQEAPPPAPGEFDAAIMFGASEHVDQTREYPWLDTDRRFVAELVEAEKPFLGVCLGAQLLAEVAGAAPYRTDEPEIGWFRVEVTEAGAADPVVAPLAPAACLLEWHHYVAPLAPGAVELARTPHCTQAFRIEGRPAWGLQFHAEVTRADLQTWLDGWDKAESRHTDLDPEAIRAESERHIGRQNELGRLVVLGFLEAAES